MRVWLAPHENTSVIVTDEDLLVDVMDRVCKRKTLMRNDYVLQYRPDLAKDKLVTLDPTLQYRQCCNEGDLVDVYLTKGPGPPRRAPVPARARARARARGLTDPAGRPCGARARAQWPGGPCSSPC